MGSFLQDLRQGLRGMRRAPVVTLVAIASLGFAIGAVTTAYSWMDRFVLHTLPGVPHPERLVSASMAFPSGSTGSISMPALREWRDGSRTVNLAGHSAALVGLRTGEGSLPVWTMCNSSNLFDVLEVRPLLGRWMTREEEDAEARVAVLGHAFWSRQFLGDSSVVGRSITLNGIPVTVIGVAPRGFAGPWVGLHFDVYVPVTIRHQLLDTPNQAENRGSQQYLAVIGRLRPGVSLAQARQDLLTLAERTAEAVGWEYSASVQRLSDVDPAATMKAVFTALLGVTVLVLLVACANVASVFLARAAAREREIAMRLALGARRSRLVRQMLTEGLALSLLAGCLGLLLSVWSRGLIAAFVPPSSMPVDLAMTLNLRVVGCALLVAVLTALLFGLLPALRVSSPRLVGALKEVTGMALGHRARLQSGLVVAQVAFALVALVCAGLFVRSLGSSRRLDVGFRRPEGVLLVDTDLRHAGLRDTMGLPVAQRLLEAVRGVPGVRSAAFSTDVPLGFGGGSQNSVRVEGYVPRRNEEMAPRYSMVSGDYFRTMEIPIMLGRQIGEEDRRGGQRVAVVNEEFARRWLGGRNPLGARVTWSGDTTWMTVVGVARNGKYERLSESPRPVIWVPLVQRFPRSFTVHVRTESEPRLLAGALRRAFAATHPDLPFLDVRTMAQHMEASLFTSRMGAYMLSAFGAVALLLSSIGLYGLMAYTVSRRTREIGVRMALGAGRTQVVRTAMRLVGVGLLVGTVAALGAGQLLRSQLLGVSPYDPATLLAVAALLAGVALAATLLPARKAARVDPIVALRHE
jgi:predicted permease